jgi:hypothetical protein
MQSDRLRWNREIGVSSVIVLIGLGGCATATVQAPEPSAGSKVSLFALPLSFEPNQGQIDGPARFVARGQGYNLFLTATEAVFASTAPPAPPEHAGSDAADAKTTQTIVRMQLVGANPNAKVEALDERSGRVNYLRGMDPTRWLTNVPTYGSIKYTSVYAGVDLVYYGRSSQLEYDLVVAPGVSHDVITFRFEGADNIALDAQGDLTVSAGARSFRFHRPTIYQQGDDGRQHFVDGGFLLTGQGDVGFRVAAYSPSLPLVIDPILSYSTYLGGSGEDTVGKPAVDSTGSIYLAGTTLSADFPTMSAIDNGLGGGWDAYVTKLTADGSALVYATYLGGDTGLDSIHGIAVDTTGAAYVTGNTQSQDFPVTVDAPQTTLRGVDDAFVTKLAPDGSRIVYSTYLGGSAVAEGGSGIAVDFAGAAYVTGSTRSADFPTVGAFQSHLGGETDAFVTKLTPDGSALVYSTLLGGRRVDSAAKIALDAVGAAYITGRTASDDFPTANAFQAAPGRAPDPVISQDDAFVAKLAADGASLVYSTYLGGMTADEGVDIAVDSAGAAYVTGITFSADFPTAGPMQAMSGGDGDAFVANLSASGSALVYATFLGGRGNDAGIGIGIDARGSAYVAGRTDSVDFPTIDAFQSTIAGELSAFVAKLTSDGSALEYSTYLGGSFFDQATGLAVDPAGNAYVAGLARSADFPTTTSALQPTFAGGFFDAFVAKVAPHSSPAFAGIPGHANCLGQSVAALARQFGGLAAAASAFGFDGVQALRDSIQTFCKG